MQTPKTTSMERPVPRAARRCLIPRDDDDNGSAILVSSRRLRFRPRRSKLDEETGAKLRAMMPWISAGKMVDKEKN